MYLLQRCSFYHTTETASASLPREERFTSSEKVFKKSSKSIISDGCSTMVVLVGGMGWMVSGWGEVQWHKCSKLYILVLMLKIWQMWHFCGSIIAHHGVKSSCRSLKEALMVVMKWNQPFRWFTDVFIWVHNIWLTLAQKK